MNIFYQIFSTFKFLEPSTSENTTNWKTYTSSKYGFQIKHPENIEVDCRGSLSPECVFKIIGSTASPGFEEFVILFPPKGQMVELLELEIGETKQICETPCFYKRFYKRIDDFTGLVNFKVFENYKLWEGPAGADTLMVLIHEGENKYTEVNFFYSRNTQANGNLSKELFYQILSTFKFLD